MNITARHYVRRIAGFDVPVPDRALPERLRGQQQLLRLRRGESSLTEEHLGDVRFVPLIEGLPGEGGREPGLDALRESLATGPKRHTLA